ncbi:DedA family protein [Candidatus Saccharibacteria bacterium]|nr:DedA family protein [Candidatus Saccharibacteria bacterium]
MSDLITGIIDTLGYAGIALLMFLEMVIPVIPSEVIMPFAGFTAARGGMSLTGVIVAGTTGSLLGATALYGIGRLLPDAAIYRFIRRYGSWAGLTIESVHKGEKVFDKHNRAAVFFGRLLPGIRSVVSLPAGIREMNLGIFMAFTLFGVAIWTTLLGVLGYVLGDKYEQVAHFIGAFSNVIVGLIVIGIIVYFVRLWRRRRARRRH